MSAMKRRSMDNIGESEEEVEPTRKKVKLGEAPEKKEKVLTQK